MIKLNKFLLIISLIAVSTSLCFAQEENVQDEQMQIWMEYMTPGPMHEMLAAGVGEWTTVSKFWMDPNVEPMVTEGSGTTEMILGGRYEKSIHTSSMMGMPTEGMWLMGYDNATEEFTAIWIDNLGTGTAIAKGTYDENTNSINLIGYTSILIHINGQKHRLRALFVCNGNGNSRMNTKFPCFI